MSDAVNSYEAQVRISLPEELAHLRPRIAALLGESLSDKDWIDAVAENPDVLDEDSWVEDAAIVLRRKLNLRRARQTTEHVVERRLEHMTGDSRYEALSRLFAHEAVDDPDISAWRSQYLPNGLVSEADIGKVIARLRRLEPQAVEASVLVNRGASPASKVSGELIDFARRRMSYPKGPDRLASITVAPNGPLGRLVGLCERLSRGYRWLLDEAIMWALTGRPPRIWPIVTTLRITDRASTSRIVLEVDPRVSRGELARAYEAARQDPFVANRLGSLSARQLRPQTAELAIFVGLRLDLSWRAMQKAWNDVHPDHTYIDARAFCKDATLAWERVIGASLSKDEREERRRDLRASALLGTPPGMIPRERRSDGKPSS